jgi:3D (Asp-Asp-Asp) domain-containing protein
MVGPGNYRLPDSPSTDKPATAFVMKSFNKFLTISILSLLGVGCATQPQHPTAQLHGSRQRMSQVRTTAYTHTEAGGRRNAIGCRLSGGKVRSAAADWSRWPLGTKFRIVDTDEVFQIDDYGSALIGTGTIDLYKTNRLEMNKWGVRSVDIDVLEWGSNEKSLAVLTPRAGNRQVRAMIAKLSKKAAGRENTHLSPAFF